MQATPEYEPWAVELVEPTNMLTANLSRSKTREHYRMIISNSSGLPNTFWNNQILVFWATSRTIRIWKALQGGYAPAFDGRGIIPVRSGFAWKLTIGEVSPDGSADENVFGITQGVAILLLTKTKTSGNKFASADMFGLKSHKLNALASHTFSSLSFTHLEPRRPFYLFKQQDLTFEEDFQQNISLSDIFKSKSVGIVTARDHLCLQDTPEEIMDVVSDFSALDVETARTKYRLREDVRDWSFLLHSKICAT